MSKFRSLNIYAENLMASENWTENLSSRATFHFFCPGGDGVPNARTKWLDKCNSVISQTPIAERPANQVALCWYLAAEWWLSSRERPRRSPEAHGLSRLCSILCNYTNTTHNSLGKETGSSERTVPLRAVGHTISSI
ncbi:hypothetical protein J3459_017315 [Metarhizium acridum]|nr:hypothetical protein J3459_017315 [Metarhizium acridum]